MAQVDAFLTNMYRGDRAHFVYTVSRDFVRQCQTPVLVLPDDCPAILTSSRWRASISRRTPR